MSQRLAVTAYYFLSSCFMEYVKRKIEKDIFFFLLVFYILHLIIIFSNMSTFGKVFRVTTYGESHCKGVGAIIDGVPPGMELTENDIQPQLSRRRPGQNKLTTPVSKIVLSTR